MRNLIFISILCLLVGCTNPIEPTQESDSFDFFLNEKTMIFNVEQDNSIEGTYLEIIKFSPEKKEPVINIPKDFYITNENCENWVIGWGNQKPYYDAGVENIREVLQINDGQLLLGDVKRGSGIPKKGQKVCFWNKNASGYQKKFSKEIISPSMFKGFTGNSIGFSSVVYDEKHQIWLTTINEVDTDSIQTYLASSTDLIHWKSENDSLPILTSVDFQNTWCNGTNKDGTIKQSALVYDIIYNNGEWKLFIDGYGPKGLRHIGMATTKDLLNEPLKVIQHPILSPSHGWMNEGVYYPKVEKYLDGYIMFFATESSTGVGVVGRAFSKDLINWKAHPKPVINDHVGWRTKVGTSSPNHIQVTDSMIYLIVAGTKQFTYGKENNKLTSEFGMGLSGNVGDAQLGVYKSEDGGISFIPHKNNPIFNNNYADSLENEHMGGNFERIDKDGKSYILYQAKTTAMGHRYAIYIREKPLN